MTAGLRPFWRYYGGKWRNAPHYPRPEHPTIVEPFAGAAGYSLRYPDRSVVLVDRSPIIAGIWRYLIAESAESIRALPDIPEGGSVDDCAMPQEARWLAGFWCNSGAASPCKRPSVWAKNGEAQHNWGGWNARSRERIASQLERTRHWRIIEGDYRDAPDIDATWHIDPPYQSKAGSHYAEQPDDFGALADWCRSRRGLVMVCEQDGADWLPFASLGRFRSTPGHRPRSSAEVLWLNRGAVGFGVQGQLEFGRPSATL